MPQHRQIRIHKPLHTIRHARLLFARQLPRRDGAEDALFETRLGEFVDGCVSKVSWFRSQRQADGHGGRRR